MFDVLCSNAIEVGFLQRKGGSTTYQLHCKACWPQLSTILLMKFGNFLRAVGRALCMHEMQQGVASLKVADEDTCESVAAYT